MLVRDRFWGKRAARRGHRRAVRAADDRGRAWCCCRSTARVSPLGIHVANTRTAVFLALAFVTLPFVVRTVQPVLETLERDVEEAAASLGREPADDVPPGDPAVASCPPSPPAPRCPSPAAISEYGSLVLLSGNLPVPHRGRLGADLTFIENGNKRLGRGDRGHPAARRAASSSCVLDVDPEEGGPPWH